MAAMITQAVDLMLTAELAPVQVHVKQYDNMSRKIECSLYQGSTLFELPERTKANVSGTRPDGNVFQYDSELAPEVVGIDGNTVSVFVTDVMTTCAGRVPVDITLLDEDENILGAFTFILVVAKAALAHKGLSTGSWASMFNMLRQGVISCSIDDDGYFVIESDDGLDLYFSMDDEGRLSVEY